MAISAATATYTRVSALVRERELTVAGLVATTVKMSAQQVLGQAAGDVARALVSAAGFLPLPAGGSLDWLFGGAVAAAALVNAWTFGLAGVILLLLLPVGGPVWAGVVPVGTTFSGLRRCAGWVRVGVSRNAQDAATVDHGEVTMSILIVDDSAPFRELARRILAGDGFDVVGTASSSEEALSSVAVLRPQVALVDINLGADSGFELARRLDAARPDRPSVVLMSTHSADEFAELIEASPANGFVPKERLSGDAVRLLLAEAG